MGNNTRELRKLLNEFCERDRSKETEQDLGGKEGLKI